MTTPDPPRQPPPTRTADGPTFSATDPTCRSELIQYCHLRCLPYPIVHRCNLQVASYHRRMEARAQRDHAVDGEIDETATSHEAGARRSTRRSSRVGDRWSFLVVEALLDGPRRFNDLAAAVPGIAPNILTDRLRRLEREGVAGRPHVLGAAGADGLLADRGRRGARRCPAAAGGVGHRRASGAARDEGLRHVDLRLAAGGALVLPDLSHDGRTTTRESLAALRLTGRQLLWRTTESSGR